MPKPVEETVGSAFMIVVTHRDIDRRGIVRSTVLRPKPGGWTEKMTDMAIGEMGLFIKARTQLGSTWFTDKRNASERH